QGCDADRGERYEHSAFHIRTHCVLHLVALPVPRTIAELGWCRRSRYHGTAGGRPFAEPVPGLTLGRDPHPVQALSCLSVPTRKQRRGACRAVDRALAASLPLELRKRFRSVIRLRGR